VTNPTSSKPDGHSFHPCLSQQGAVPRRTFEIFREYVKETLEVRALQIPKDVQDGIREIYGEEELLRRTAEQCRN
jgi:hypothetical protein